MIQRIYLIAREIAAAKFVSIMVILAAMLASFTVGLFRLAGDGLSDYVRRRFASSIPPNTIRISTPQPRSAFLFETDRGPMPISGRAIRAVRRMAGVTAVFPVAALRVPLHATVSYLGFTYRSDVLAFGVPLDLVRDELKEERYRRLWRDPWRERVMPVLVPRAMLRSYNDGMAEANRLPRLSERGAVGFGFRLMVGRSSLRSVQGHEEWDAVIAGFTDRVDSFALIVPYAAAEVFNRRLAGLRPDECQYAYVRVKDHPSLLRVSSAVRAMGLVAEAERSLSKQIMDLQERVSLAVAALQSLFALIAAVAISFATVIATLGRGEYYRTLRVIGASKLFCAVMVLAKYAIIGFLGAWAGTHLLGWAAGWFASLFQLSGVVVSFTLSPPAEKNLLLHGTLIPLISTVPAIVRLYVKGLGPD